MLPLLLQRLSPHTPFSYRTPSVYRHVLSLLRSLLRCAVTSTGLVKVLGSTLHEQANDQAEKTKDGTEDLNNKNLDEPVGC